MSKMERQLPQLGGGLFLTDGGLETTLIFHDGIELPHFAAFVLLRDEAGRDMLRRYYERYIAIARDNGFGFILESPTWRASADWGRKLGYSETDIAAANEQAIRLMAELMDRHRSERLPMVVSGCIGPRGDGYVAEEIMTPAPAAGYHMLQAAALARAGVDMISAITMTNADEAIGIVRAAVAVDLPVVISFTVETDGRLPTGQTLRDAIAAVDVATEAAPAYYMINCAHPSHFDGVLIESQAWTRRVRGLRANASCRSHQELNELPDLDAGDPVAFGREHAALLRRLPRLAVLGGCCGTDHRHVEQISQACLQAA